MSDNEQHILSYNRLSVSYGGVQAVRDFSLDVDARQIIGLVGESGSGKSTVLKAAAGLLGKDGRVGGGSIMFGGAEIGMLDRRRHARLCSEGMSYVFQDPVASLDPLFKIGTQFDECIRARGITGKGRMRELQVDLLSSMGFDDPLRVLGMYPSNLSGGMCQRVVLAMCMAREPQVILADEPTSALDVTVQAQVVELLKRIRRERGVALLIVSHNIAVIADISDYVGVMYAGTLLEYGTRQEVIDAPAHPYTRNLIAAAPKLNSGLPTDVPLVQGSRVRAMGCPYASACDRAGDSCAQPVSRVWLSRTHWVACARCGAREGEAC